MNLDDMRAMVRRDLHDEDEGAYRWTDDELDRHIAHAVNDLSERAPLETEATLETAAGSRALDLSSLTGRVSVEAVEYPADQFPKRYQRFSLWGDTLTLLGDEVPDGADAVIYYGQTHTLDAETSTIPAKFEDLIAIGACGYAAVEWAGFAINRVNAGGEAVARDMAQWGNEKLADFRQLLKRLGRRNRVRVRSLYRPYYPPVSKATDAGP